MSSNAYRCNLEVEDLGAGMHLVKELNEFPFGLIPIKVEFGRQEDAIHVSREQLQLSSSRRLPCPHSF